MSDLSLRHRDTSTTGSIGGAGDSHLRIQDRAGLSAACAADAKYTGDWLKKFGGCAEFCFDVRIFEIPLAPNTVIYPSSTIFGPSGSKAWFTATVPATTDSGSAPGWHHICAPIVDGATPPSGPDDAWSVNGGTWNSIITGVTSVLIPVDFTQQPSEVVGYDNICLTGAPCGEAGKIKICKIAGSGVAPGTPFTFTVGSAAVTVPAGPAPEGTCVEVSDPSLTVGSTVVVSETIPSGVAVSAITVDPAGSLVGAPDLASGAVSVTVGPRLTTVSYTDVRPPPPETSGCYADAEVSVVCNPDGTYTVTIAGGPGRAGDIVGVGSRTAGVTVSPPQRAWAPTTTRTVTGATPGQSAVPTLTDTTVGGGSRPGTDSCCSGEIELVMPPCPKPKIDLGIEKKQIPADGQGIAFEIDVTNVGAPITCAANQLTVIDAVPAGMTITTQTDPDWSCTPLPEVGPATLTCTRPSAGSLATGAVVPDPIVLHGVLTHSEQPLKNCATVSVPASVGEVPPSITVSATATGEPPHPPVTNRAAVAPAAGSGLVDGNAANARSCVTVRKPGPCPSPQVANAAGACVDPPPSCHPPMVPGAKPGQCVCPEGTRRDGDTCVKVPTACPRPLLPGSGGTCLQPPPPACRPPMVPGPRPGQCVCPTGLEAKGGRCREPVERSRPHVRPDTRQEGTPVPFLPTRRREEVIRRSTCGDRRRPIRP